MLTILCTFAALFALAILVAMIAIVVIRGAGGLSWQFLTTDARNAGAAGGIVYHIAGTLLLVLTAAAVAAPLAAGTGIISHFYLPPGRGRRAIERLLHALNGVPSIVFGLFGLAVFVRFLGLQKSWLAGGLVLGMMIVPTVTVAFTEKLRAIPRANIEAAFGLGLSRPHVVTTVILPQSAAGLVTGVLLGIVRAAGETAPILFTAAIFAGATLPRGIVDSPVLALPYHIFVMAQDAFDPAMTRNLWATATVLLGIVMTFSAIALPLRMRLHEEARHD